MEERFETYKHGWADGYKQGKKDLYAAILKLLTKKKENGKCITELENLGKTQSLN